MDKPLNLRDLTPGSRVKLVDGSVLQVVENSGDGAWLICAAPGSLDQPEPVFIADIIGETD